MRRLIAIAGIATALALPCASGAAGSEADPRIKPLAASKEPFAVGPSTELNPTATAKSPEPVEIQATAMGKSPRPSEAGQNDIEFIGRRIPVFHA